MKNKLIEAIREKAKGNYVNSDTYTMEERFKDMITINERLRCNMLRVMELQEELKNLTPHDVFYAFASKIRAEIVTLNKQIRRDTLLLEKLMYIG